MNDDGASLARLVDVMRTLLGPEGCPWDKEQTLETLRPYVVEEAHEVVEAIDRGEPEPLREELGDLLFQVVFQSELAAQKGWFGIDDVVRGIADKMVRRHPWVFGDEKPSGGGAEALARWEAQKSKEQKSAADPADQGKKSAADPADPGKKSAADPADPGKKSKPRSGSVTLPEVLVSPPWAKKQASSRPKLALDLIVENESFTPNVTPQIRKPSADRSPERDAEFLGGGPPEKIHEMEVFSVTDETALASLRDREALNEAWYLDSFVHWLGPVLVPLLAIPVLEIEETEHLLGPGDFAGFPAPTAPHQLRNPFQKSLICLMGGSRTEVDLADFPRDGKRMFRQGDGLEIYDSADAEEVVPANMDEELITNMRRSRTRE